MSTIFGSAKSTYIAKSTIQQKALVGKEFSLSSWCDKLFFISQLRVCIIIVQTYIADKCSDLYYRTKAKAGKESSFSS